MAKLLPVILNEPDRFGNWKVRIRIGHKSKNAYLPTNIEVGKKNVDKHGEIKTDFIVSVLSDVLKRYKEAVDKMPVHMMTAVEIKNRLVEMDRGGLTPGDEIDFIAFSKAYMEGLVKKGKKSTADTFRSVVNSLEDYLDGKFLGANNITSKFLLQFEGFLRSPKTIRRMNRGKLTEYEKKGLEDRGVHNRMRDIRILFNKAKDYYNDEELGIFRIPNNPFKKYKVVDAPESEDRDLSVEQILKIRDVKVISPEEDMAIRNSSMRVPKDKRSFEPDYIVEGSMGELARDLGLLSFYLCGMNAADMYELLAGDGERVNYKRKKTRGRRKDEAFISIAIPEVARPLYNKYAGRLQKMYVDVSSLNGVIKKGMDRLGLATGIEGLQFIKFRHSFGSLARNKCRFSKDDVALAMNHKDNSNKVTDIYISKDWSIIDEVQAKTVGLLSAGELF